MEKSKLKQLIDEKDQEKLEELVESIVDDYLDELELEAFAQDTANIIVDLKHQIEDLQSKEK